MAAPCPVITVVTVVFNAAAFLEQAIQSVLSQKVQGIEYIIVDGGSIDGTLEILQKYQAQLSHWISEPDHGIFDAMNKGISRAQGSYIVMLNADDWYEPGFLAQMKDHITGLSQTGTSPAPVLYGDYYAHDESFTPPLKTTVTSSLKYWRGMTICHQTLFVPRSVYQTLGLYNLDYHYAADYEFFLRLLKHRVPFQKVLACGVNFRKGGASDRFMNPSIAEVSNIVRGYFGVFSKQYALFLLTNRLPSLLGHGRRVLDKTIGTKHTARLRKLWRKI